MIAGLEQGDGDKVTLIVPMLLKREEKQVGTGKA